MHDTSAVISTVHAISMATCAVQHPTMKILSENL